MEVKSGTYIELADKFTDWTCACDMIVKTMSWKGSSVYNQLNIQTILRVDIHSRKTLFILGRKTESGNIN